MSGSQLSLADYMNEMRKSKARAVGKENHLVIPARKRKRDAEEISSDGPRSKKGSQQARLSFGNGERRAEYTNSYSTIGRGVSVLKAIAKQAPVQDVKGKAKASSSTPSASKGKPLTQVLDTPQSLNRPTLLASRRKGEKTTSHIAIAYDTISHAIQSSPRSSQLSLNDSEQPKMTIPTPPPSSLPRINFRSPRFAFSRGVSSPAAFRNGVNAEIGFTPRTPSRRRRGRNSPSESLDFDIVPETPQKHGFEDRFGRCGRASQSNLTGSLGGASSSLSDFFRPAHGHRGDDPETSGANSVSSLSPATDDSEDPFLVLNQFSIPSSQTPEELASIPTAGAGLFSTTLNSSKSVIGSSDNVKKLDHNIAADACSPSRGQRVSSSQVVPSSQTQELSPPKRRVLDPGQSKVDSAQESESFCEESSQDVPTSQTQSEEELVGSERLGEPILCLSAPEITKRSPTPPTHAETPATPDLSRRSNLVESLDQLDSVEQSFPELYTSPIRIPSSYATSFSLERNDTQESFTLPSPIRQFKDMFDEEHSWPQSYQQGSSTCPHTRHPENVDVIRKTVGNMVPPSTPSKGQSQGDSATEPDSPGAISTFMEKLKDGRRAQGQQSLGSKLLTNGGAVAGSARSRRTYENLFTPGGAPFDTDGESPDDGFPLSIPDISESGLDSSCPVGTQGTSPESLPSPMKKFLGAFGGEGSYPNDFPESLQ